MSQELMQTVHLKLDIKLTGKVKNATNKCRTDTSNIDLSLGNLCMKRVALRQPEVSRSGSKKPHEGLEDKTYPER